MFCNNMFIIDDTAYGKFMQRITSNDTATGDTGFGTDIAVSLDGLTAVFGAPTYNSHNAPVGTSNVGAIYIFSKATGVWVQEARFEGGVSIANLGKTVTISADGLTVATHNSYSRVEIYRKSGTWQNTDSINTSGFSTQDATVRLSSDGLSLFVSAPNTTVSSTLGQGSIFVYNYTTSWGTPTQITGPGPLSYNTRFGWNMSTSDDGLTIVTTSIAGAETYTYTRPNTTSTTWTMVSTTVTDALQPIINTVFISGDGNVLFTGRGITGAGNTSYIIRYHRSGDNWVKDSALASVISPHVDNDFFGEYISSSYDGSLMVTSGKTATEGVGIACLYNTSNNTWATPILYVKSGITAYQAVWYNAATNTCFFNSYNTTVTITGQGVVDTYAVVAI